VGAARADAVALMGRSTPANSPFAAGQATEAELPMDAVRADRFRARTANAALTGALAGIFAERASDAVEAQFRSLSTQSGSSAAALAARASGRGLTESAAAQPGYDSPLVYNPRAFDPREYAEAGALYVFTRRAPVLAGGSGETVVAPAWPSTEQVRLSIPFS